MTSAPTAVPVDSATIRLSDGREIPAQLRAYTALSAEIRERGLLERARWFYVLLGVGIAVALGGTSLAGGRFFLIGTLVGALIIQALTTTIYAIGVPPQVNLVVKALLVLVVLLLQSPAFRAQLRARLAGHGGGA